MSYLGANESRIVGELIKTVDRVDTGHNLFNGQYFRIRRDIASFSSSSNDSFTAFRIRTNITKSSRRMFKIKVEVYGYNENQ